MEDWLNYHHLLYFWHVAKEGSIAKASETLMLAPPTISAQIKSLEQSLGEPLFNRRGRNLVMTDAGRMVFGYAEQIFALGRELKTAMKQQPTGQPLRLTVGVTEPLPKLVVRAMLGPVFAMDHPVRLVCREGKLDRLLGDLATHRLDVVLADEPTPPSVKVQSFNHELGSCGIAFFASAGLAKKLKRGFPGSLDGAPMILPTEAAPLRRNLNRWFADLGIRPTIIAECDDSAQLKVFGMDGLGAFAVPDVIADTIEPHYGCKPIGETHDMIERFYAISVERRIKHPAVIAISDAARQSLFK